MIALYIGLAGLLAFVLGTLILGIRLRGAPTKDHAERWSRMMHFLFFAGLGAPFLVCMISPGLTHLDALVGLRPLPWWPLFLVIGLIVGLPGLYLLGATNKLLRALGNGANAFRLTQRVVAQDVYQYTRNPMSLGYYLGALGLSLMIGSSLLTIYVICGLIPAHLFFLTFFEERELELRHGEAYLQYKRQVPFLIPSPAIWRRRTT